MSTIDIYSFDDYAAYLKAWMDRHGYTHRQVAMLTGQLDGGVVSNIVARRRPFTPELRDAFASFLKLSDPERAYLDLLVLRHDAEADLEKAESALKDAENRLALAPGVTLRNRVKNLVRERDLSRSRIADLDAQLLGARSVARARHLTDATVTLLNRWSTAAISELARCPGFQWDPAWIVQRLPGAAGPSSVRSSLAVLAQQRVLEQDGQGGGRHLGEALLTPGLTDRKLLESWYMGLLRRTVRGVKALFEERWAWERSSIGATTLALPPSALPKAKALVDQLKMDLLALSEGQTEAPDEVYQMFVVLFPVSAPTPRSTGAAEPPPAGEPTPQHQHG